jgi:hypothetical protein
MMRKHTSRKPATHKKAHGHHAAKTQARRPHASRAATVEPKPEVEIVDEEFSVRSESRVDDDSDEEVGIYGPNRGETAG